VYFLRGGLGAVRVTQVLVIGETRPVACVARALLTSPLASALGRSTKLPLPFLVDLQQADAVKGTWSLVEWTIAGPLGRCMRGTSYV
jgi:hypothetical protein